jgi:hypothetical protein
LRRIAAALAVAALCGCAGPNLADHAGEQPAFDFRRYFDGTVLAHGLVSDRGGKVLRRFTVTMQCEWSGERGTLDERFVYSDGERQRRVWHVRALPDGSFRGTAADVVGEAHGAASGAAFNWRYTLLLPVRGSTYEVQFDDWMYQVDQRVVLNKATMSKFGVRVGEVTLSFNKEDDGRQPATR